MFKQLNQSNYYPWFIFGIALFLYLANLGGNSIYILDEAKNATCAAEMLERGDWVVPTFNQELRTDKPPLHYFFMMVSYSVFGVTPFAARFFSAIFGALTILISFLFVRRFHSEKAALWTSFILLSSIHLSIQFHLSVPDPYLIFFFTASVFSFYAAVKEKKLIYLLALYLSVGLGTLSKGPVAIGLPGLIFLLFLIFSKRLNWKELKQLRPFSGAVLVLLIALPWYILVHLKTNGQWTDGFFFKHNLGRFSSEMEGHGGIFLLTILFVLLGLFPFAVFIVQALKHAWKNRKSDFILLNLVAGLAIVIFFSISRTKLPNYTVPAYPYFAALLGVWLSQLSFKTAKPKASMITLLVVGPILVPALYIGITFDPALAHLRNQAFFFLPIPVGFILAYFLFTKNQLQKALRVAGISCMLAAMSFAFIVFPKVDQENPVAKSLHLVKGKEVRYYGKFNPSYAFYLRHELVEVEPNSFSEFFENYPDGVIISTKRRIEKVDLPANCEISFSARDILETPTTVLITKK